MDVRTIGPAVLLGIAAAVAVAPFGHDVVPAHAVPGWHGTVPGWAGLLGVALALAFVAAAGALAAHLVPERPRSTGAIAGLLATLPAITTTVLPVTAILGASELLQLQDPEPARLAWFLAHPTVRILATAGLAGVAGPLFGACLGVLGASVVERRNGKGFEEHGALMPLLLLVQTVALSVLALASTHTVFDQLEQVVGPAGSFLAGGLLLATVFVAAVFIAALVRQALLARRSGLLAESWLRVAAIGLLVTLWLGANVVVGGHHPTVLLPLAAGLLGLGGGLGWARAWPAVVVATPRRPIDVAARALLFAIAMPFVAQLFMSPVLAIALFPVGSIDWLSGAAHAPDFVQRVHELLSLHRAMALTLLATAPVAYVALAAPVWFFRAAVTSLGRRSSAPPPSAGAGEARAW